SRSGKRPGFSAEPRWKRDHGGEREWDACVRARNTWSWREESNLQPVVYKTTALPLSYASVRILLPYWSVRINLHLGRWMLHKVRHGALPEQQAGKEWESSLYRTAWSKDGSACSTFLFSSS